MSEFTSFEITKEGWRKMTEDERSWVMYNTFITHRRACDKRFKELSRRKYVYGAVQAVGGIMGGIIAYLSFGKFKFYVETKMKIKWIEIVKDLWRYFLAAVILIGLAFVLFFSEPAKGAEAAEVTLTWDSNSEADLAGYKVYSGTTSGEYGTPVIVPLAALLPSSNPVYIVTGLDPSKVWYFVVTAYDTEGMESDYSNEVNTGGTYYEDGKPPRAPTGLKALWQRLISWIFGGSLKIKEG